MSSLHESWSDFANTFIPDEAPIEQKKCMKHSFYVGALIVLKELQQVANSKVAVEERQKVFNDLVYEVNLFNLSNATGQVQ